MMMMRCLPVTVAFLASYVSTSSADIVITEFAASSAGQVLEDADGEKPDWIEIYNNDTSTVSLGGYFLTDDLGDLKKWKIPDLELEGKSFVIVFASDKNRKRGELHTNFKLSAEGEFLALVDPDGLTVTHNLHPPLPAHRLAKTYGLAMQDVEEMSSDALVAFSDPTPGAPNAAPILDSISEPTFSHSRGFQESPFALELTCEAPGAIIRYTLNGATPSAEIGTTFSFPIEISKTTIVRAIALNPDGELAPSEVATHSFIFTIDVVTQSADPPEGWPPSVATSSRREQVYIYDMLPPEQIGTTANEIVRAIHSLPTISLVTDLENWFDKDIGIYHNANERGRLWERPVSAEWIDPSGAEPGFQINAGVRIRGGGSRRGENPKHAFRLYFRSDYGPGKLRYPIHQDEGVQEFDDLCLRTAQNNAWSFKHNDQYTFLRDVFVRDCQRDLGRPYTRSRYCHLFLNGLYWGLYQTQEHSEASYAAAYFGGSASDYDVVKAAGFPGGSQIEATDGDLVMWTQIWEICNAIAASKDPNEQSALYQQLQGKRSDGVSDPGIPRLLDVENLIDYMILNFYVGNLDGPIPEWSGNRVTRNWFSIGDRKGNLGFQFFHHDSEKSMESVDVDRTGPYEAGAEIGFSNPQWFHQQLTAVSAYRKQFADRAHEVLEGSGPLSKGASIARLQSRIAQLENAVVAESARWGRTGPPYRKSHWDAAVNNLLEIVDNRSDPVIQQLRKAKRYKFGMPGDELVEAPLYPQ